MYAISDGSSFTNGHKIRRQVTWMHAFTRTQRNTTRYRYRENYNKFIGRKK